MDITYEILQVTNLSESIIQDCVDVVWRNWPDEAPGVRYVLKNNAMESEHITFVAKYGVTVLGFISGHSEESFNYIDSLFIDAQYHRRGIGGALMRAYIGCCHERGVGRLVVWPLAGTGARLFYSKYGFVPYGVQRMMRNMMLGR